MAMESKRDYRRKGTKDFPVGVNYRIQDKDYFSPHTYHPEAEMFLIYEGKGTLQVSGTNIPLETGNFYFIYPNEVHSIQTHGTLPLYSARVFRFLIPKKCLPPSPAPFLKRSHRKKNRISIFHPCCIPQSFLQFFLFRF